LLSEGYDQVIDAYLVILHGTPESEQQAHVILHDDTGELHRRYEVEHGGLLLVLPDGYIGFWVRFGATAKLRAYVQELFAFGQAD